MYEYQYTKMTTQLEGVEEHEMGKKVNDFDVVVHLNPKGMRERFSHPQSGCQGL